ncbi:MAG: hypothetical protein Q9M40_11890 [Sulfurimonas sp.]|nr:hypothetical protein [Sulfurimonas sp.]
MNLDVNFKNITPHKLDGDILLKTINAKIDTALMKKDFNITLPKTSFVLNLDAKLHGDDIDYAYKLNSNLANITSGGKIIPQPLSIDIKYGVDIQELAVLQPITGAALRGAFKTKGIVLGTKKSMLVKGTSDIGGSDTTYKVALKEFQPQSVLATIKGAKLQKILYMLGQPNFAKSDLDVNVKLTSLDLKNLAGFLDIDLKNGFINSKDIKTTFSSSTHVDLKGKNIEYKTAFLSNLAKLNSSGSVEPDSMKMDLKYSVYVKELALLKPITSADVRGSFRLNGNVLGDKKKLLVDGKSDFASSDTSFSAVLNNFKPASLKASMKNLKLKKVLYMLKQPHYADGIISLNVDIPNVKSGRLKGTVISSLKQGVVDSKYMTKAYEFSSPMSYTSFDMKTTTTLKGDLADTKVDFNSNLLTLDIARARFNIENASLLSDYKLKVLNLDKLFFLTERHMKGSITANGELKKIKI